MADQSKSESLGKEVKITYETLFDLLRREKNRSDIQQLESTFYSDVRAYLAEKVSILESLQSATGVITENAEREQVRLQLDNIKRILRDLYERRERKIITLALNKSRTGSDIVSNASLLEEEKMLLDDLVKLFSMYRGGIIHNIFKLNEPNILRSKDESGSIERTPQQNRPATYPSIAAAESTNASNMKPAQNDTNMMRVVFVSSVDEFIGPELEPYGPFQPDDEAELPQAIADILIKQGHAEEA